MVDLARSIRSATADNGAIGCKVGVADGLQEAKTGVEAPVVEVVEKQSADAARFVAVFKIEVAVAPLFEARINVGAEGAAGVVGGLVPVAGVVGEAVVGGEVVAAAEPPNGVGVRFVGDEKAHVGV